MLRIIDEQRQADGSINWDHAAYQYRVWMLRTYYGGTAQRPADRGTTTTCESHYGTYSSYSSCTTN
jgi:hypothetical protein